MDKKEKVFVTPEHQAFINKYWTIIVSFLIAIITLFCAYMYANSAVDEWGYTHAYAVTSEQHTYFISDQKDPALENHTFDNGVCSVCGFYEGK